MISKKGHIIIVSNRLPISIAQKGGQHHLVPGSGGLVTALAPVLCDRGGIWIGWDGSTGGTSFADLFRKESSKVGYILKPISLTPEEVSQYYEGFSNATLWPLFHDFLGRCQFYPETWNSYCTVNQKVAHSVIENSKTDDLVWVHDYHLIMVGKYLRAQEIKRTTAFFLHIPFPPWDLLMRMPWRKEIIDGLLQYDLTGSAA